MSKHRARLFLLVLGVTAVAAMTGAFVTNAPASSTPSVAGQAALVGAPSALACNGAVNVRVTLTGTAGVNGSATDVMLTLDLSGSMGGDKFTELKSAATALVRALDAGDGADNGRLGLGNRVGIVTYRGSGAPQVTPVTDQESTLTSAINDLLPPGGSSPHADGITRAQTELGVGAGKKAIVLVSDGISNTQAEADNAAAAAAAATASLITMATIGIGSDANTADLTSWASPNAYQAGTPGPIDSAELVKDIGAAVAVPVAFTLTETPGKFFNLGSPNTGNVGNVVVSQSLPSSLTWSGSLADGQVATLDYIAARNGADPSSVTSETVSTSALTVTGGSGAVTPATRTIDVLPCDAGALLDKQTCTANSCTAGGTVPNGVQFSLNAGSPPAGTEIFVAGLTSAPPTGTCPGFDGNANGVQIDIRPLTTPGNFEIRIPKAALGTKKWWQTDVCVGTNLKFITKIGSLANLRPGAVNSAGRYWGLLPSIPRYTFIPGLGLVKGPSVTFRGPGAVAGDAVIRFTIPYAGENSKNFTTNGLPGYDPRAWGG